MFHLEFDLNKVIGDDWLIIIESALPSLCYGSQLFVYRMSRPTRATYNTLSMYRKIQRRMSLTDTGKVERCAFDFGILLVRYTSSVIIRWREKILCEVDCWPYLVDHQKYLFHFFALKGPLFIRVACGF